MNKPEVKSPEFKNARMHESRKKATAAEKEALKKNIAKMRERDSELVTGVFQNLENPATNGSKGAVCFGLKLYPGDEYTFYELWDGERYSLPRGVARHLNVNCFYREYQQLPGEFGKAGIREGVASDGRMKTQNYQMSRKIHRYAFRSLEYMDDDVDMVPSNLTEVTVTP